MLIVSSEWRGRLLVHLPRSAALLSVRLRSLTVVLRDDRPNRPSHSAAARLQRAGSPEPDKTSPSAGGTPRRRFGGTGGPRTHLSRQVSGAAVWERQQRLEAQSRGLISGYLHPPPPPPPMSILVWRMRFVSCSSSTIFNSTPRLSLWPPSVCYRWNSSWRRHAHTNTSCPLNRPIAHTEAPVTNASWSSVTNKKSLETDRLLCSSDLLSRSPHLFPSFST